MKIQSLVLGVAFAIVSSMSVSAQVVKGSVSASDNARAQTAIPKIFIGTPYANAFAVVAAQNEYNFIISQGGIQAAILVANPCSLFNKVHSIAYPSGAVYTSYPHAFQSPASSAQLAYNAAFAKAEQVVSTVQTMNADLNFACETKNDQCCDITGAAEKCKANPNSQCEMAGSTTNCASGHDNCPQ
jgi:hypothetical protein